MKPDDFTLLVRVRNRHHNIKKVIEYYNDLECKKILLDHSSIVLDDDGIVALDACGFEYLYYSSEQNMFDVFSSIMDQIDTPFMVDSPDDDFALKSSIKTCVEFLKENDDYASCDGLHLMVNPNRTMCPKYYGTHHDYDFDCEDLDERVSTFLVSHYYPLCHTVMKTDVFCSIQKAYADDSVIKWQLGTYDRFFTFIAQLQGKNKILPMVSRMVKAHPAGAERVTSHRDVEEAYGFLFGPREQENRRWFNVPVSEYMVATACESEELAWDKVHAFFLNQASNHSPMPQMANGLQLKEYGELVSKEEDEITFLKNLMWEDR
jgi:glycosyltransferase domain-containing protein